MLFALGLIALVAAIAGVAAVAVMAARQATEERAPPSEPNDFVAPVSSGGYAWRGTDESLEEFHARIARENARAAHAPPSAPSR
jgi:hypothetical protein